MTRIELDDQILNHDKFIRVGKRAGGDGIWLWLGLRAYCAQRLSDGFIPDDMLDEVRGPRDPKARSKCLQVLKDEKLVEDVDGGVFLHDYLDHSSSREQVEDWRRKARERKAASRGKSRETSHVASQRDNHSDGHGDTPSDSDGSHSGVTDTRARGEEGGEEDICSSSERGAGGNPNKTPGERCRDAFAMADPGAVALFDAWKAASGKDVATYDWKRRELFERLLHEGVTVDLVRLVVTGAKLDHWASEVQKLAPSSILGSAEQREKYSALALSPPKQKEPPGFRPEGRDAPEFEIPPEERQRRREAARKLREGGTP